MSWPLEDSKRIFGAEINATHFPEDIPALILPLPEQIRAILGRSLLGGGLFPRMDLGVIS